MPKHMLTSQDLKLIGDLIDTKFDQKFKENVQYIISEVNKIVDPLAKDVSIIKNNVAILKKDMLGLKEDFRSFRRYSFDQNELAKVRLDHLENPNLVNDKTLRKKKS